MELIRCVMLLLFCTFENVAYTSSESLQLMNNKASNGRLSYLHTIEEDLLHYTWEEHEEPCLRQLLKVIRNVHNSTLWATWIWDSMQFPVGQLYGSRTHLGNYDQCMNLPWKDHPEFRTQYCLAELNISELDPEVTYVNLLGSVQQYLRYKTKHHLRYNSLIWGICVPSVCKTDSISKFADAMFRSSHFGQMQTQVNITVNSAFCQVAGELDQVGFGEYLCMSCIIFLIIMALLCTFYVSLKGFESNSTDFAKAFYIKSNAQWLMKAEDQSVKSVLGIRMISTSLIVAGHLWYSKNMFGVGNAGELDKKFDDYSGCIVFNIDMVVDTFFMVSGLLLTKSLMEQNGLHFNLISVIAKRYIRFVRLLLLVIWILPIVLLRGDPAPLVKIHLQNEVVSCTNNWWKAVLMIGNYGDTENMCYPILWSLSCDFHLFVIGAVIFWIYRKNRTAGIKAYVICAVTSVVLPILHGYIYKSAATIPFDFRASDSLRKYPIADPAYVHTHLRAGPYFVGMAIGYLMALFHPEKHIMSKKTSMLAFVTFLAMFTSLNVVSGIYNVRQYSALEGALFSVVRRNVFAALVGFLIIICEYGTLPFVSNVLSWSGFVPLCKLSYGVYLTHFMVLFRMMSRTRVPLRSYIIDEILATVGVMAITFTMSLLMYLFWEAPVSNLFLMIFKSSTSKREQNGSIESNGRSNGISNGRSKEISNGKSNGLSNGKSNGVSKEISSGLSNGKSNGLSDGKSNGVSKEISNGLSNAKSNGLSNGKSNGVSNGRSKEISNGSSNGKSDERSNGKLYTATPKHEENTDSELDKKFN